MEVEYKNHGWARLSRCWSKIPLALILTFGAMSFRAETATAQCANSAHLSCGVYQSCFEKYCPCEDTPDGYFIRYGEKYCKRFLDSDGWSDKGKAWRDKTLLCLQEKIVPKLDISDTPICNCSAMKTFAFQIHVQCYTQPEASVCDLELSDYKKIYDIIDVHDDLFGDPYGRKQMRQVLEICRDSQNSTLPPSALDLIIKIIDKLQ